MTPVRDDDLERLQQRLGYRFRDPVRLRIALTHKSWAHEHGEPVEHNERLEFLGDAVLSLCVGHLLMHRYPDWSEGTLSQARAVLVSTAGLAEVAGDLGLGPALQLGRGEARTGGRDKPSILADAFEAVTAAVYLDAGFERTLEIVESLMGQRLQRAERRLRRRDPKTRLQERIQAVTKRPPSYVLEGTSGPEHDLRFTVALEVDRCEIGIGVGRTKKEAEQDAAAALLQRLSEGESLTRILGRAGSGRDRLGAVSLDGREGASESAAAAVDTAELDPQGETDLRGGDKGLDTDEVPPGGDPSP
jgi:ribonuclease-3